MTEFTQFSDFNEEEFLGRTSKLVRKLGKGIVEKALIAFHVTKDPKTPVWAKTTLVSALVYLGLPIDAVPDVIPVAGFTDDVATLAAAMAAVATSIRWRHVRAARNTMKAWGLKVADLPDEVDPNARSK